MSYNKTIWATGDVVTSAKLNKLEEGVRTVNGEYVPTVWATGDVVTADKLNKLEQGVADGGGGSNIPTITLNIHNIGEFAGDIPVVWHNTFTGFMPFKNGYLDIEGIDTSLDYDANETKSYLSVPTTTMYLDNGNFSTAGGFGFAGYTPDNPISAVSDLVNCTIQQFEEEGENYWCLLVTDITKDASATINIEMSNK